MGNYNDTVYLTKKLMMIGNMHDCTSLWRYNSSHQTRLGIRGCTALGPALLIASSMASSRKRSKVIICTDGCANEGIGSLPDSHEQSEEKIASCRAEYQSFGDYAKDAG